MRLRIDLAYDGSGFHGWAAQPGLRTVQNEVDAALATVLRMPSVRTVCAGRTDTGVHARGQVVHVDVADPPTIELQRRLNGVLPADVRVRWVGLAPAGFDARYSPLWRRYVYRIADAVEVVDPLTRGHVLTRRRPLDEALMSAAGAPLVGLRDFAAFCKQRVGATTTRTLLELSWVRDDDGVLVGTVRADAFCHRMVRSLVGCLVAVGEGRRPPEWAAGVLVGGVRDATVRVVPAHGLTLEEVCFPPDAELAARADLTRSRRG
ncbi:MAG: tRNA pseudouridine(38-40) synthase TruA [Nocardioides sp.]